MSATKLCSVGRVQIGPNQPLAIIAGPCVLESYELGLTIGTQVRDLCARLGLAYIFKASFDKANRSSIDSPRGPGLEQGLIWIAKIGRELGVPTTTDIHEAAQAEPAARVVDLLQIPAFLCRQTDLLVAAGRAAKSHTRAVNVKKGQFVSPDEMVGPVKKLGEAGCANVMLTERGTFFGYGRLVNDFLGVAEMMEREHEGEGPRAQGRGPSDVSLTSSPSSDSSLDTRPPALTPSRFRVPICFDCTHSTQQPGKGEGGKVTGGRSDLAPMLARAATAAGVHALFLECHPEPKRALSDAATMIPLAEMPKVLRDVAAIRSALESR